MEILRELLDSVAEDCSIGPSVIGSHLIAVTSRRVGLAANLKGYGDEASTDFAEELKNLEGGNGKELAGWVLRDQWLEAGIGMAALNSLIKARPELLSELNAKHLIGAKATGKNLAVVGHFPFVEKLRPSVQYLWVIEKQPRTGDLSEEEGFLVLPEADVVAITGSSLINHTLQRIIGCCKPGSFRIMLGPSTPLSRILFDFGLDAIGGCLVEEERSVLASIRGGAAFRQLKGVRTVVMTKDSLRV
jgi:uncharacterized protein (DUF4213/DUF364 family)